MQPKTLKTVLSCLSVMIGVASTAQSIGVDSKKKSVFTYYSLSNDRISLSADGSLSYTYVFRPDTVNFVKADDKKVVTTTKRRVWALTASLNTDDDLLSFTGGTPFRPGLGFKFGRHKTVDTFYVLDKNLKGIKKSVKTFGGNLIFKLDNIKLYDSVLKATSKKYPVTIGGEYYLNFVFRNSDTSGKFRSVLAFTASLIHSWNDEDMLSYKELSEVRNNGTVVAFDDFEGKYGVLDNKVWKFRLSAAFPFYYRRINPIPFAEYMIQSSKEPVYHFGLFTNFLKAPLEARKFAIPSSLGIGIDWRYMHRFYQPTFFVKGDISL